MASNYTRFLPRPILLDTIEAFIAKLRQDLSLEQLPSLAARAADLARSEQGALAGAFLATHAILLTLWNSADGAPRRSDEWEADRRLVHMLATLIEHPSEASLAGIGRAWQSRIGSAE